MQGFSDELKQRKINLVANGYDAYCLFTMTPDFRTSFSII